MPLKRVLIDRLLNDPKIDDFESNLLFREEIKDDEESVGVLLDILRTEGARRRHRARKMLVEFGEATYSQISDGLKLSGSNWRQELLDILYTIASLRNAEQRKALFALIKPNIVNMLGDTDVIDQRFSNPVEVEYEARVCDEAFLLCMYLLEPDYFDADYLQMDEKQRNREISVLKTRIGGELLG